MAVTATAVFIEVTYEEVTFQLNANNILLIKPSGYEDETIVKMMNSEEIFVDGSVADIIALM